MRWADEQGALVRGLAHALSNRVGTVVAVASLLTPGEPASAPIVGMLRDEGDRLEELLGLLRTLGGESGEAGEPEPIHLPDVIGPAVALHAHHPELRDVPVTVTPDAEAAPVRARREGLVRALLVLLGAVKRDAAGGVAIRWGASPAGVTLVVGGAAGASEVASAAADVVGLSVHATRTGYEIVLPELGR